MTGYRTMVVMTVSPTPDRGDARAPVQIRRVTPADVPVLVALIGDLAEYEHSAHLCTVTPAQLHAALFSPDAAVFGHVAEVPAGPDAAETVIGMALWYLSFSTWDGAHGIHLEDLYVRPDHRGRGAGRALLATLAGACADRGYTRLEWEVIDWNAPSLAFYRGLGAGARTDWIPHRLAGRALAALAAEAPART